MVVAVFVGPVIEEVVIVAGADLGVYGVITSWATTAKCRWFVAGRS